MKNTTKTLILSLVMLIITASFTAADMNVSLGFNTEGGNGYVDVNPNTGTGETHYYLDGKDFDKQIGSIYSTMHKNDNTYPSIYKNIYQPFMHRDFHGVFHQTNKEDLDIHEYTMRSVFEHYFVPRLELQAENARLRDKIASLEYELEVMRNLHSEEEICESRLEVGFKHSIDKITCNNKTYVKNIGGYVVVQDRT